ncbi:MAG: AraC family transcriptional regulator [Eubacterium sp.]|nr:AraC family transcriptional regulator [Eubacterium sp.]
MSEIKREITQNIFMERENDTKHPTYENEMSFYNLIAEGKLEEVRKEWEISPRSNDEIRGVLSDNPARNMMYHFIAMVTIVTRVCISNGMPQDVAYKMSDAYIRKADKKTRIEELRQVEWETIVAYTEFMRDRTKSSAKSKQIIQCVDYIHKNIHKSITVSELAEEVVLNETYLSKLFKKEMNCTVSEFIRNEKIEEACWLLKYTDKTSIEIATDLSFSSHSYFISVFKKVTGTTPKEYRNNNFRKM